MKKILPSILSADFTNLSKEIDCVINAGADLIHIDIMDGHFVPNITIGPQIVKQIKAISSVPLDVHLMITNPLKYIDQFADAGSNFITFHVEVNENKYKIIEAIKKRDVKVGISLSPDTPVSKVKKYISMIDMVLIMSVYPGFGGQKFIPSSINKIKELKTLIGNSNTIIEIDGGVNLDNIKLLSDAGVNFFVAGNTIFKEKDRKKIISLLKSNL